MIYVIAALDLHPKQRDAYLDEFRKVMPLVRAEAGCIEYVPATDADTDIVSQHKAGADSVVIVEKWESIEALKAHDAAPHMQTFRSRVKDYVRSREIRMLSPV